MAPLQTTMPYTVVLTVRTHFCRLQLVDGAGHGPLAVADGRLVRRGRELGREAVLGPRPCCCRRSCAGRAPRCPGEQKPLPFKGAQPAELDSTAGAPGGARGPFYRPACTDTVSLITASIEVRWRRTEQRVAHPAPSPSVADRDQCSVRLTSPTNLFHPPSRNCLAQRQVVGPGQRTCLAALNFISTEPPKASFAQNIHSDVNIQESGSISFECRTMSSNEGISNAAMGSGRTPQNMGLSNTPPRH
ncbi:hypothetical protein MCOR14_000649 [Pyricularia oryzae]|uniref:Uncharacterized protein n=1 Tax=Pyricularia oryzae TaxID=318829 RepID=A0A4P7N7X0_PYROR|nr:hypothetical protein MCOR13_001027 [Pyricularia oryzae]KAI6644938.1 hypothetical protein MCOR14_000649 [Pyricularia oryzae]QBZ57752.1 hypothetical protein PoMZ_02687 [Pyricularia oryzae]